MKLNIKIIFLSTVFLRIKYQLCLLVVFGYHTLVFSLFFFFGAAEFVGVLVQQCGLML